MDDEAKRSTRRLGAVDDSAIDPDDTADMPVDGNGETEMLSREELLENAVRDRDKHRENKPTTPVRHLEGQADSDATREMPVISGEPAGQRTDLDERTRQYDREQLGISDGDGEIGFPGRVDDDLTLEIPPALARKIDLSPGDVVVVKLHKIDD